MSADLMTNALLPVVEQIGMGLAILVTLAKSYRNGRVLEESKRISARNAAALAETKGLMLDLHSNIETRLQPFVDAREGAQQADLERGWNLARAWCDQAHKERAQRIAERSRSIVSPSGFSEDPDPWLPLQPLEAMRGLMPFEIDPRFAGDGTPAPVEPAR